MNLNLVLEHFLLSSAILYMVLGPVAVIEGLSLVFRDLLVNDGTLWCWNPLGSWNPVGVLELSWHINMKKMKSIFAT